MCVLGVSKAHARAVTPLDSDERAEANAIFIAHVRQCLGCRVDLARDK